MYTKLSAADYRKIEIMRPSEAVREKLKYLSGANSGPTTKLGGFDGNWGLGPLPVLQTLRGKEPFYRRRGFSEERVIAPLAGRRSWVVGGFRFRRSGTWR